MKRRLIALICCLLTACGGNSHEEDHNCVTNDENVICTCDGLNCTFKSIKRDRKVL